MKTICPECGGSGMVAVATATGRMVAGEKGPRVVEVGTVTAPRECRTCDGTGRLDGFKPPV